MIVHISAFFVTTNLKSDESVNMSKFQNNAFFCDDF